LEAQFFDKDRAGQGNTAALADTPSIPFIDEFGRWSPLCLWQVRLRNLTELLKASDLEFMHLAFHLDPEDSLDLFK
jgi:hypothetical protein